MDTHSENEAEDGSQSPPEQLVKESATINPEITEMEVHHHPEVEKKTFTDYLLEGLMIFVAVTLGFFAESLHEYLNEHSRAKEYAKTMLNDLEQDTADLKAYLRYTNYAKANTDTLMQLLSDKEPGQIPAGNLYWYGLWGGAHQAFVPHDATIHQMENSGSLRYITNEKLNREIAQYDQLCRSWQQEAERDRAVYLEVRKARARIFEFKYNEMANKIWQAGRFDINQSQIDSFKKSNPPLLTVDKTEFNEYLEMVRSRYLFLQVKNAGLLLDNANQLISDLKKVYDLDEN